MRRYLSTPVTWTWSILSYNSPFVSVNILYWTQPRSLTQPTDTHHTGSSVQQGQQYRCCRSAASRRGLAGEPSETLTMTMKFLRCSMPAIITDTHNTASLWQQYRCCRSAASRRGLAGEPSETLTMKFPQCSMSAIITDTHHTESSAQQHRWRRSAASRRGLAGEPSETLTMKFLRCSMPAIITDTHHTESSAQQYQCCRSAASRRGLAGEPSETLTMKFPQCSMSAIITDTHRTVSLGQQDRWCRSEASEGSLASKSSKLLWAGGSCIFFITDDYRRPRLSGFSTVSGVGHWMEEFKVGFGRCAVTAPVLQLAFGFCCCPLYLKVWISRLLNKTCFSLYVG